MLANTDAASSNPTMRARGLDVRVFRVNSDDYFFAFHAAFNVRRPTNNTLSPAIKALLANAGERGLRIDPVLGAFDDDGALLSAGAIVESPGRAAILFLSHQAKGPVAGASLPNWTGAEAVATLARKIAQERGVRLLQLLVEPDDGCVSVVAARVGFRLMTQLIYLRRECSLAYATETDLKDLSWEAYCNENVPLFLRALELSYVDSLDCPEIVGLRSTGEVLATHRASGEFLPSCWWVATRDREPVGVVLLNGVREPFGLEVVYMGVAQPARGTGVADALLARAAACCASLSARYLTLAVDARNTPANCLYRRWGFTETQRLNAWIATPPPD